MKRIGFLICISLFTTSVYAQKSNKNNSRSVKAPADTATRVQEPPPVAPEPKIFTYVEQMPEYPGGNEAMNKFIARSIQYPRKAIRKKVEGTVGVQLVITKEGKIEKVHLAKGIGAGCDEEALRVIGTMPDWRPGMQNGRSVQASFSIPVRFRLADYDKKGHYKMK